MRCKKCKRQSGIGGAAMTQFTCQVCGNTDWYETTAHPPICHKCSDKAKQLGKCHYCYGELK